MIRGDDSGGFGEPRDRPRALDRLVWAAGGFCAGIAFWHAVGFWSLVTATVLGSGSASDRRSTTAAAARPKSVPLETGTITGSSQPRCVALALHHAEGQTRAVPCVTGPLHHVQRGVGAKADLDRAPAGAWSTAVR